MAEVIIGTREHLENALRRFKRLVEQEGILGEVKKHSSFRSRGQQRRDKSLRARQAHGRRQRAKQKAWDRKTSGGTGTGCYGRVR